MATIKEPASYRDGRAQIVYRDNDVFRLILPAGARDFEKTSGIMAALAKKGLLLPFAKVDAAPFSEMKAVHALRHPRIAHITYPYEWTFNMLRDAALLHIDLHLAALEKNATLSDGSAYNIQFQDGRPIFIDCTSIIPYADGAYWNGYDQFCEQFLNPLLLSAKTEIPFQSWYRGMPEGLPARWLARLLPWHARLSPAILFHVLLNAGAARHAPKTDSRRHLPPAGLRWILNSLRKLIAGLSPPAPDNPHIVGYERNFHSATYKEEKQHAMSAFVEARRPACVLDLGCNIGTYSLLALRAGAESVVGLEADAATLDGVYIRAKSQGDNFLPLVMNLADCSPAQGWLGAERRRLEDRVSADAVFALAVMHHLCLTHKIPLDQCVRWIVSFAPEGLIEFVPPDDPLAIQLMGRDRGDFPDYSEQAFEARLCQTAEIIDVKILGGSTRRLYQYRR